MRLISANVNGIRAAARRGGLDWLDAQQADVIALQEVRASDEQVREVIDRSGLRDWHVNCASGHAKGHAGVAVLTRHQPSRINSDLGPSEFVDAGRWLEVDVPGPGGPVTVVSTYVHTGEAGTPRQGEKMRFLDAVGLRLAALAENDAYAVLTGDLNVCHRADDLKNWKGNVGKSGSSPRSRPTSTCGRRGTDTSTSTGRFTVRDPGRTRGGRGGARRSTTMRAGGSTTSSRAVRSLLWRRERRSGGRRHTPSGGATMLR